MRRSPCHFVYEIRPIGSKLKYHGITVDIDKRRNEHYCAIKKIVFMACGLEYKYSTPLQAHSDIGLFIFNKYNGNKLIAHMHNLERFYHFKVVCICDTREDARKMEMNLIHKAGVNSLNILRYKAELLNKSKK